MDKKRIARSGGALFGLSKPALLVPSNTAHFGHSSRIGHIKLNDDFAAKKFRHADHDFLNLWIGVLLVVRMMTIKQVSKDGLPATTQRTVWV